MNLPSLLRRNGSDPFRALTRLQQDFERLFQQLEPQSAFEGMDFTPTCELNEDKSGYSLKFDIPGVKKEDIKVEVDGTRITVSAERRDEKSSDTKKRHYSEISYGAYTRSFNLPSAIDEKKVDAKFENGVLTLQIPKSESASAKQVPVQ